MEQPSLLVNAFVYLAAVVVMVPLARRLGLGSVLGYLAAGVVIGPWGLKLITNVEEILHFAEFGVVLLLFLIGLELNPAKLRQLWRPILGLGGAQVAATTLLLGLAGVLLGLSWSQALVIAMALSLSSTAIALQSLKEQGLLLSQAGRSTFAILLFQDVAVIPMLAAIPLLGGGGAIGDGEPSWQALKVAAVIAFIIVGGHYLTRPVFRYIAGTRMREVFTAFSLLLVIGIALLMQAVGLSMALGAFLAGALLAESEYRHELEAEIEPFKGLLLGLFFISVGMSIHFGLLLEQPLRVIALVAGLLLLKLAVLWPLAARCRIQPGQRALFAFLLGQGGEFAFVLFTVAAGDGLLAPDLHQLLVLIVALSMLATPLLLLLNREFIEPRFLTLGQSREETPIPPQENQVIIAGFGRFGRVVGRLLHANRVGATILDHDPDLIDDARRFGYLVYYGDATRHGVLEAAGAAKAKLLIIALEDPNLALKVVDLARHHYPHLLILARAHDYNHAVELMRREVHLYQREVLESALRLGEQALIALGHGAYWAKHSAHRFREHDRALVEAMYATDSQDGHATLIQEAREDLARVFAADEAEILRQDDHAWN